MADKVDYRILQKGWNNDPFRSYGEEAAGNHNDNTAGSKSAPINGQRDIFAASINIIKPERNSDTWCIDSLYTTSERSGSKVKDRELADVDMGIECVECPNQRRRDGRRHNLGNCAESVPFEAMRGNPNPSENASNLSSCTRIPSPCPGRISHN
ncbi:unnamed protein product [Rhizophagus irregularis]|nr:unnamed protein product [Rhizophagus irregularis]CAB4419581.1 unnamed protein product [Rhizophagus irregularis]